MIKILVVEMKTILMIALLAAMLVVPSVLADPCGTPNWNAMFDEGGFYRSFVADLTDNFEQYYQSISPNPGMGADEAVLYGLNIPTNVVGVENSNGNAQPVG